VSATAHLFAREVFDLRGNPNLEATSCLGSGATGSAIVDSSGPKGRFEAVELYDGGARHGGGGRLGTAVECRGRSGRARPPRGGVR
jgi:enolase